MTDSQASVPDLDLRLVRYFTVVAECRHFGRAANELHIAQPSLSRQIRDVEAEVGVMLLERGARGIGLTAAGRALLDHARLAPLQVEAASEGARRAAQPQKMTFTIGFLTGNKMVRLLDALRILHEEEPAPEITLASQSLLDFAGGLVQGKLDVAFLRREARDLDGRRDTRADLCAPGAVTVGRFATAERRTLDDRTFYGL